MSHTAQSSPSSGGPIPCFGILCPHHADCASYAAVEGSDPEGARMNSCLSGGERVHFVQRPKATTGSASAHDQ